MLSLSGYTCLLFVAGLLICLFAARLFAFVFHSCSASVHHRFPRTLLESGFSLNLCRWLLGSCLLDSCWPLEGRWLLGSWTSWSLFHLCVGCHAELLKHRLSLGDSAQEVLLIRDCSCNACLHDLRPPELQSLGPWQSFKGLSRSRSCTYCHNRVIDLVMNIVIEKNVVHRTVWSVNPEWFPRWRVIFPSSPVIIVVTLRQQ